MPTETVNKFYLTLFALLGSLSFMFNATDITRLLSLPVAITIILLHNKRLQYIFIPFSTGTLAFASRLTYWDSFEFADRIDLLFIASVAGSGITAIYINRQFLKKYINLFNNLSLKKRTITVLISAQLLLIIPGLVISEDPGKTIGDEPYYIVLSQSIANDRDFNIFNQHYRNTYRKVVKHIGLKPHGHFGKGIKKLYYTHLPGLPLTLTPFIFADIKDINILHKAVRIYISFFASMLTTLIYLFGLKLFQNPGISLIAAFVFVLTSPVFFMGVHIFPEIQATLIIMGALYLLLYKPTTTNMAIAGLLLGLVVFWGVKYVILSSFYSIGFVIRYIIRKQWKPGGVLLISFIATISLFFWYLFFCYGSFSINSIYFGMPGGVKSQELSELIFSIPHSLRLETFLAYFIDQRDGLFPYNLFYILSIPGFILTLFKEKFKSPSILLSIPPVLYIIYHSATTFRAGDCPQGRFLIPIIPFMLFYSIKAAIHMQKSGYKLPPLIMGIYSLIISAIQLTSPLTLYQPATHEYTEPMGLLFQQLRTTVFNPGKYLPAFISGGDNSRSYINYIAILIIIAVSISTIRKSKLLIRTFSLAVSSSLIAVLLFKCLTPGIPLYFPEYTNSSHRTILYGNIPPQCHGSISPIIENRKKGSLTLSSFRKLSEIRLEIKNEGPPCSIHMHLFDNKIKTVSFDKNTKVILTFTPKYSINLKNRHFYRLNFTDYSSKKQKNIRKSTIKKREFRIFNNSDVYFFSIC